MVASTSKLTIHSTKSLTVGTCQKPGPKRKFHRPTIHFQGLLLLVSGRVVVIQFNPLQSELVLKMKFPFGIAYFHGRTVSFKECRCLNVLARPAVRIGWGT